MAVSREQEAIFAIENENRWLYDGWRAKKAPKQAPPNGYANFIAPESGPGAKQQARTTTQFQSQRLGNSTILPDDYAIQQSRPTNHPLTAHRDSNTSRVL